MSSALLRSYDHALSASSPCINIAVVFISHQYIMFLSDSIENIHATYCSALNRFCRTLYTVSMTLEVTYWVQW